MKKTPPYAAKPDHAKHLWVLFLRKSAKKEPEMVWACTGGALQMLIAHGELAKKLRVPVSKIEVVAYRPRAFARAKRGAA
jgi:hypothetical protein